MIQKNNHSFFILENKRIHHFHIRFFRSKFHQIGEILQTFSDHDQRSRGRGRRRFRNQIKRSWVEDGWAQKPQKYESGDRAGFDKSLIWPLLHHISLETVADIA